MRYRNPAAAEKVFTTREGKPELDVLGRAGGVTVYRMEGFDDQARYVGFRDEWMLCMLDRARLEAILAGKPPAGPSFATHPLLAGRRRAGGDPSSASRPNERGAAGRPLLPPHSDFNVVYDAAAHLRQLRRNLKSRRAVAAKHAADPPPQGGAGAVAEWDRQLAGLNAQIGAFGLDGLRGLVVMSQLNVRGDGGTVVDVSLAPDSVWLGLARQRAGVGRLLALVPGKAVLTALSNANRPLVLLRTLAVLAPMASGATGEAVGLLLREAPEPLRRLMAGYVVDAAVVELPRSGDDRRAETVLCLGLNDAKAAEPAIAKVVAALRPPAAEGRVRRVVRSVRHAGRTIRLLSEAAVEGAEAALLAWVRVEDTLVIGSIQGVKQVAAAYAGRTTLLAATEVVGEIGRTPGRAGQLVIVRPGRWIKRFAGLGLPGGFAADFPVVLKVAAAEGGLRLRSNISLPALAATWGVVAFQMLLLGVG